MQPLQNCIGPNIRIGREILCLPYAGFFILRIGSFNLLIFLAFIGLVWPGLCGQNMYKLQTMFLL